MPPKAVVFDIGNVLIGWDPERIYDQHIGSERRRALYAAVDLEAMNLRSDLGEDLQMLVADTANEHPDWASEIRMWWDCWPEMASPAIDGSVRLLRLLRRKKIPVFALSNFGNETLVIAQRNFPFLEEFEQRFISAELGVVKPDPEIYRLLEEATGLSGADLLFTDDRPENIAAAEARGWLGHVFDGSAGFGQALVACGLLSAQELE